MFIRTLYFMIITIFSLHCMHIDKDQYIKVLCEQYNASPDKHTFTEQERNIIGDSKNKLQTVLFHATRLRNPHIVYDNPKQFLITMIQTHNQLNMQLLEPYGLNISNFKGYLLLFIESDLAQQKTYFNGCVNYFYDEYPKTIQQLKNIKKYALADFTKNNKRINWILTHKLLTNQNHCTINSFNNNDCIACFDRNIIAHILTLFSIRKNCFLPKIINSNNECKALGHLFCFSQQDKELQERILSFYLVFTYVFPAEYTDLIPTEQSSIEVYNSLRKIAHVLGFKQPEITSFLDS